MCGHSDTLSLEAKSPREPERTVSVVGIVVQLDWKWTLALDCLEYLNIDKGISIFLRWVKDLANQDNFRKQGP
jgi:hypothetical protein